MTTKTTYASVGGFPSESADAVLTHTHDTREDAVVAIAAASGFKFWDELLDESGDALVVGGLRTQPRFEHSRQSNGRRARRMAGRPSIANQDQAFVTQREQHIIDALAGNPGNASMMCCRRVVVAEQGEVGMGFVLAQTDCNEALRIEGNRHGSNLSLFNRIITTELW